MDFVAAGDGAEPHSTEQSGADDSRIEELAAADAGRGSEPVEQRVGGPAEYAAGASGVGSQQQHVPASANDPKTWLPFLAAVAQYKKQNAAGIVGINAAEDEGA